MVRIQGTTRNVTPGALTALGGAANALDASTETVQRAEQQRRDAVQWQLGVQRLQQALSDHDRELRLKDQAIADAKSANEMAMQGLEASQDMDMLGPQVRDWMSEVQKRAATMDPDAGAALVRQASQMLSTAQQSHFRSKMIERVHQDATNNVWRDLAARIKTSTGSDLVDLTGNGPSPDDMSIAQIEDMGEHFLTILDAPDTDPSKAMQDYETLYQTLQRHAIDAEDRLKFTQFVFEDDARKMASDPRFLITGGFKSPERQAELDALLTDWRVGRIPNTQAAKQRIMAEFDAARRGNRLVDADPKSDLYMRLGGKPIEVPESGLTQEDYDQITGRNVVSSKQLYQMMVDGVSAMMKEKGATASDAIDSTLRMIEIAHPRSVKQIERMRSILSRQFGAIGDSGSTISVPTLDNDKGFDVSVTPEHITKFNDTVSGGETVYNAIQSTFKLSDTQMSRLQSTRKILDLADALGVNFGQNRSDDHNFDTGR